jgi:hypothetical protein
VSNALKHLLADRFPQVAADVLDPLVRLLHLARTTFAGDLDKFLVLAVVGLRATQHPTYRIARPEEIARGEFAVLPSLGVNVRSIAESLDIPKETVRRKVQELATTGWIVRDGGRLFLTAKGYSDLAPIRTELQAMVASYHSVGDQLLPHR